MNLVNAKERLPVKFGMYWVRLDKQRTTLRLHEFDHALERYDEVWWVEEEQDKFVPAKTKSLVEFKQHTEDLMFPLPNETIVKPIIRISGFTGELVIRNNIPLEADEIKKLETTIPAIDNKKINATVVEICEAIVTELPLNKKAIKQPTIIKKRKKKFIRNELEILHSQIKDNCQLTIDDPLYFLKLETKNRINIKAKRMPIHSLKEFGLKAVKKLYPCLYTDEQAIITNQKELLWVYGVIGYKTIRRRIEVHYKCLKQKQNGRVKKI